MAQHYKHFLRFAITLLILGKSDEVAPSPCEEGFDELDGVVSLRRRSGRRRDSGGTSHAPDGAQKAEVRGLADREEARGRPRSV